MCRTDVTLNFMTEQIKKSETCFVIQMMDNLYIYVQAEKNSPCETVHFFKLWEPTFQMQPGLITKTEISSLFGDCLQCPNFDIRSVPHGNKNNFEAYASNGKI